MLKQLATSLTLLSLSLPALAEVQIKAVEEIVVMAIDGQEIRQHLFCNKEKTYTVDDGQHTISVQYKQLFNPLYTSHEVVKSDIVTLTTGHLTAGQYQLVLINPPQDVDAAKKFAEQPILGLKDAQGHIIAQQIDVGSKAKSWLNRGIFSSVLDLRQDSEQQPEVNAQQATIPVQQVKTDTLSKDQQLIELWKTATPQERQKFTAWLGEQAVK